MRSVWGARGFPGPGRGCRRGEAAALESIPECGHRVLPGRLRRPFKEKPELSSRVRCARGVAAPPGAPPNRTLLTARRTAGTSRGGSGARSPQGFLCHAARCRRVRVPLRGARSIFPPGSVPRSSRWASHLACRHTAPLPATATRSCSAGGMFGENPSAGLPPERGSRRFPRRSDAGLIDFPSHGAGGIAPGFSSGEGKSVVHTFPAAAMSRWHPRLPKAPGPAPASALGKQSGLGSSEALFPLFPPVLLPSHPLSPSL
ncbi:uncharacterized protein LOC141728302 [Zonotrichia albicollis]|uniref:uncharacterized protein LOC141728302 n=1 Tax=Zonotrichia albicollis TaxID=44394 RepID=UPI003D811F63